MKTDKLDLAPAWEWHTLVLAALLAGVVAAMILGEI